MTATQSSDIDTKDLVRSLRAWGNHNIESKCEYFGNILLNAARVIVKLERDRDKAMRASAALHANVEEPQEIDVFEIEGRIARAKKRGGDTIKISARELWRMASDHRETNDP